MSKYGQYCPIARATEVLGDRWTLLIVRDLFYGAQHFNDLDRGLPGIPRALLVKRLRLLEQAGLLMRHDAPHGKKTCYELTRAGRELEPVIDALVMWGANWCFGEPTEEELDPVLLLWWMRDGVRRDLLTQKRIVVEFHFRDVKPSLFWLVMRRDDVSLCIQHPGFDSDVLVTTDLAVFYQVWLGRLTWGEVIEDNRLVLDAIPTLIRDFTHWFTLSPFADAVAGAVRTTTQPSD
jgi:DNA-binding HxlR family transcriptional regulator